VWGSVIQLLTDWLGYSFRKVTQLAVKGFQSIGYKTINVVNLWFPLGLVNTKTIVIGDTVFSLRLASRFSALEKVYWVDSPLEINAGDARLLSSGDCLYATLPYWCRYYNKIGLRCSGYIPRPVDAEIAESVINADCRDLQQKYGDYIVTVGAEPVVMPPKKPRKGLDIFDAVCEQLKQRSVKCVAVTNKPLKNAVVIRFGSLSEYELLRLVKCAKLFLYTSRSEGFGMPPVEAMAVKQLVVASNAPCFEHVIGIKYDYAEEVVEYLPEAGRSYIGWDYRARDVLDAVDYALSLSYDEREKIVEKAYFASKAYTPMRVAYALNEVYA
jgi:glycosyltransferase involved in cell wall biosynthesis